MTKIKSINGEDISDTSFDLSKGFPAFFRAWIVANNIEMLTSADRQKAKREYSRLNVFIQRGWCGVETSFLRSSHDLSGE